MGVVQLVVTAVSMMLILLFCSLLVCLCNGQTCTSPVYSSSGATIRGPCPSSQIITPVSSMLLKCSFSYSGNYLSFWNITDIGFIFGVNSPNNSSINITINSSSSNGFTTLALPVNKLHSVDVQCGLCHGINCFQSPFQVTVISLPVQLISFGK